MNRIFFPTAILVAAAVLLSGCSSSKTIIIKPDEAILDHDPKTLYDEKQFDKALMAMLEADPALLEEHSARKLLWRINDRIVTVHWYLQKSIIELLNGHKDTALKHIAAALKLYPGHRPSLLLKQRLDSIQIKKNHKTPRFSKPSPKKDSKGYHPSDEDLNLADYYLMAGNAYFENGRLTLAKASWLQGLDIVNSHKVIKKKLVNLITNEGLQLFGQGDIKASIETWEEGLRLKPDDPEIKRYLDKARKAQEKVRSLN